MITPITRPGVILPEVRLWYDACIRLLAAVEADPYTGRWKRDGRPHGADYARWMAKIGPIPASPPEYSTMALSCKVTLCNGNQYGRITAYEHVWASGHLSTDALDETVHFLAYWRIGRWETCRPVSELSPEAMVQLCRANVRKQLFTDAVYLQKSAAERHAEACNNLTLLAMLDAIPQEPAP